MVATLLNLYIVTRAVRFSEADLVGSVFLF
jgi:hypothetical protein